MSIRKLLTNVIALVALLGSMPLFSDGGVVIVTHPSVKDTIDEAYLYRLYFGKTTTFPDGSHAQPLLYSEDRELLGRFASNALDRSARQLRSFWARQIFTGRGTPPKEVSTLREMKGLIASDPSYIGYLPREWLDDSLRMALTVQ